MMSKLLKILCNETGNEYTRHQTKGLETHPDEELKAPLGMLFYIDFVYQPNDNSGEI